MRYILKIHGPQGYGFTQMALPVHLRDKYHKVISHSFEPDGGTYEVGVKCPGLYDIPHIKIPTGMLIWELEFADEKESIYPSFPA